mgnify:CR=1 FL=1
MLAAYLGNASWLAPEPDQPYFISHRGEHQTFDPTGVGPQDCTATRIAPVTHTFIENTLPAIGAAFDAGAEIVEIQNARPNVPYPFTKKIDMALNRPFASHSTYVLYADVAATP